MWHARGRSDADRGLVGKPKERYHLEGLGIDGKITLKFSGAGCEVDWIGVS
jgi:hypothetical protein